MGYKKATSVSKRKDLSRATNSIDTFLEDYENNNLVLEQRLLQSNCENLEPYLETGLAYISNITSQFPTRTVRCGRRYSSLANITQRDLEVPSWRIKNYNSLRSLRIAEDLSDEVFEQRHLRFEKEEKQQQRWDLQKLREQKIVENLRKRQDAVVGDTVLTKDSTFEINTNTFWPSINSLQFIEISDTLPVCAFGTQLRRLKQESFSLPWLNSLTEEPKPLKKRGSKEEN